MSIHSSAADFVSSRTGDVGLSETCQQGAYYHQGASEAGASFFKIFCQQVIKLNMGCLERTGVPRNTVYLNAKRAGKFNKIIDIQNVRNIVYGNFFRSEQGGADNLQCLVFSSLWCYLTLKPGSAINPERSHLKNYCCCFLRCCCICMRFRC